MKKRWGVALLASLGLLVGVGVAAASGPRRPEDDDEGDEPPSPGPTVADFVPLPPPPGPTVADFVPGAVQPPAALNPEQAGGLQPVNPLTVERTYPTPGFMYPVQYGDTILGEGGSSITYRALRTAGFLAGKKHGLSDSKANEFGKAVASVAKFRLQYADAMVCAGVNDAAYATWGYDPAKAKPGPQGRAIRLLPYHADNRERTAKGLPWIRNIRLGNWQTPGDKSGTRIEPQHKSFEWLFLPEIDLDALWADRTLPMSAWKLQITGWHPPFEVYVEGLEPGTSGHEFGCQGGEVIAS